MEKIENSEIDIDKIKSTNAITLISLAISRKCVRYEERA